MRVSKIKKPKTLKGSGLVSGSRLELPTAAADMNTMLKG